MPDERAAAATSGPLRHQVTESLLGRIVVEVPRLSALPAGWAWAELDLDHNTELPASRLACVSVSAATRKNGHSIPGMLARLRQTAVTPLQFEADGEAAARG